MEKTRRLDQEGSKSQGPYPSILGNEASFSIIYSYTSSQCWNGFKQDYQNPIVAQIFDLFKKLVTKQKSPNPQKSMPEHTAEMQQLMQSMTDLTELTPDPILFLAILLSLSKDIPN